MLLMMLMVLSLQPSLELKAGAWLHERLMAACGENQHISSPKLVGDATNSLVNLANLATVLRQLAEASGGHIWTCLGPRVSSEQSSQT